MHRQIHVTKWTGVLVSQPNSRVTEARRKLTDLMVKLDRYRKRNRAIAENPNTPFVRGQIAKARSESYLIAVTMLQDHRQELKDIEKALGDV